jgi:phospholipase C
MVPSHDNDHVQHVVLLILENHSFDQMLGCFKEVYKDLDGIDPQNLRSNLDDKGRVYSQAPTTERQMFLDPHHEVPHVAVQLGNANSGFVLDFAKSFADSSIEACSFIMGYYPRNSLPALHALATDFTICDRWHASLPGPTWPNRFFALSGTSMGRVNMPDDGTHRLDLPGYFQQTQDTIFDRLSERGIHWKVYFRDIPQTTVLAHQREPINAARYFYMDEFFDDARGLESAFPQFCLVEPSYMGWSENDDHPPHDIMQAEKLIADVYNAIRANDALWQSTLLIIFYDEHGGFYDHVVPPSAVPPDDHNGEYSFDRLGVRVPALLVSPWVDRGFTHELFDHTSVLRYLIDKWQLGGLGRRTDAARSIAEAITGQSPRTDTISRIEMSDEQLRPPDPEAEEKAVSELTAHHKALQKLATYLKNDIVTDLPRTYSFAARCFEGMRSGCEHLLNRMYHGASAPRISIAEPDRLAHHTDATPRDNVAYFLMQRKKQAVAHLSATIHDEAAPTRTTDFAVQTLGLITGRAFDREEKGTEHAKGWLQRHAR